MAKNIEYLLDRDGVMLDVMSAAPHKRTSFTRPLRCVRELKKSTSEHLCDLDQLEAGNANGEGLPDLRY